MPRRKSAAQRRRESQARWAMLKIAVVAAVVLAAIAIYIIVASSRRGLDDVTLCPTEPVSHTVLLVDVTDRMNVAQRQDFLNQLDRLKNSIPRYGRLTAIKVDSAADRLLTPVITRCNPGTALDENEYTGDPKGVQELHDTGFSQPLDSAFLTLIGASGADRSPILESVQSVALTEFQTQAAARAPRRLILASDLLQNTHYVRFYGALPDAQTFIDSAAFRTVRTNLAGIDVELWMLQRPDAGDTQPRALPDLWTRIIEAQGGRVVRIYRVSG
jgi:hypothetical protein